MRRSEFIILASLFLRAGSQFGRKRQRYHSPAAGASGGRETGEARRFRGLEGQCRSRWKGTHQYVKRRLESGLSLFQPPAAGATCSREIRVSSRNAVSPKASLQGLKVLVIDDSKTIRRTAETLLAKEGCTVFTAVDGFDALSKIADHQPDIVFVDIMMPRLDGYQTCSLIKHNKVFKDTPVIMLSSKDGLFDRARGRLVGSEQYLTKPFTKDELLAAIQNHVTR
jgi:twitching motility two-component system response regulator PilG